MFRKPKTEEPTEQGLAAARAVERATEGCRAAGGQHPETGSRHG